MKLYYPKSHYHKNHRGLVFPLLKPFIKGEGFTDAKRKAIYGFSEKDFEFTDVLKDANYAILPMAWNYYIKTKQEAIAVAFIKECASLNKKVLAFNAGDFGVRSPYFKNVIVLRSSGYKSKFNNNQTALPVFITDPLEKYFDRDSIFKRSYQDKAVVGFCGQSNPSLVNAIKEIGKTFIRNIRSYTGFSKEEPQQLLSTSFLRGSVLKRLQNSTDVETNFIVRKKYRAGVTQNKETHKTTLEFYENLKNTDYVVCVRGAGNFSVRFYEALAMGRIPVFINTNSPLPLENLIDWKKHVVWVDYKNRNKVSEKVRNFHQNLSAEQFQDLQQQNRSLWQEHLTLGGFFKSYIDE